MTHNRENDLQYEHLSKNARLSFTVPSNLLKAVRKGVKATGMPYQRFIRAALEHAVSGKK